MPDQRRPMQASQPRDDQFEQLLPELRRVLAQVQHGSVTLIVQDGRVVQIDATHKLRLSRRDGVTPPPTGRGR